MHNRSKSKQRRKNMRKWMEHKARQQVFDAMASFGEYRHPDFMIDGVPMKWRSHRWVPVVGWPPHGV